MTELLELLFKNLNDWRHLPAYQLERRADIFFSLYLKEVVEKYLQQERGKFVELEELIIPEFPLKSAGSNKSTKVDYSLFAKDRSSVIFIELKTDNRSTRKEQVDYLFQAQKDGFQKILNGFKAIFAATNDFEKYFHLARKLEELGFLKLPGNLQNKIFTTSPRHGLREIIGSIEVNRDDPDIKAFYLKPLEGKKDEFPAIDFDFFANHVGLHQDELSRRFADSLRAWKERAGAFTCLNNQRLQCK